MPFPLAHPAAVLPLKRCCPRALSLPALIIGSVSPDASYLFSPWEMSKFAHKFLGSLGFCLPAALVMLALFYALRKPVVEALPPAYKRALQPLCRRAPGPVGVLLLSLMLGIWTHLVWDSFTHTEGWLVQHWPVLGMPVFSFAHRTAKVCHLLGYACSFVGVIVVFLSFERWKQSCLKPAAAVQGRTVLRDAAVAAGLVLPIAFVKHLFPGWLGLVLVAVMCVLLGCGLILRMRRAQ